MPLDLLTTLSKTTRSVLMPTFPIQNYCFGKLGKYKAVIQSNQGDILYTTQPIFLIPICTG